MSFAGTWHVEVFSDAVHKLAIVMRKIEFLTAKLFEPMSEIRAEGVKKEIREVKMEGAKLLRDVCVTKAQMLAFSYTAVAVYGKSDYLTDQQRAMLSATGMGEQIVQM